jgi:hypothetical protein
MGHYDKDALLAAIWDNPEKVTGLHFTRKGAAWQSRQRLDGSDSPRADKTILRRGGNGQIFVNYNGGSFPQGQDIWQYLQWRYETNDFIDVLNAVGEAYGIQPDMSAYSPEQVQRAQQRRTEKALLKDVATWLRAALKGNAGEAARQYLNSRNMQPSERMGAWNAKIRAAVVEQLQKRNSMTKKDAEDFVRRYFPLTRKDGGKWVDYADDYQLALPFYNGGGNVIGFALRSTSTTAPTYTDENGIVQSMPKYVYSKDMPRGGGYCETLRGGSADVYIVEGILDAEAMKQHGFTNVAACGGMTPTDNDDDAAKAMVKTLLRYNAKKLIYIPDCEYTEDGVQKTAATIRTINALLPHLSGTQDGAGFVSLRIANLETADSRQNHTKVDADTFLQTQRVCDMQNVLDAAAHWYEYELKDIVRQHAGDYDSMTAEAVAVFMQMQNPAQRGRLKAAITSAKDGYLATLKAAGLTAAELSLIERDGAQSAWATRMAELRAQMQSAETRESVAALLTEANRIQHADTYADFAAQVNITREDMHALVAEKPDYLQTTWALYKSMYNPATKSETLRRNRYISFAPAAVTIIAAPTNHGKTLVLLQTAINVAKTTGKKFLYISFENDAEQLYIRAVAAYMGDVWRDATYTGEDGKQHPVEMPRAEIRSHIKGDMPAELFAADSRSSINIDAYIRQYWQQIAPRLSLVRTSSDIDAVVNNVCAQVEAWRNTGVEVGGIFVDYLQLLHYAALHARSRTDEVKGICDRLNDMAKATKLPVILAAQFNRDATKAGGDTLDGVELANIGESSGIENIAEDVYLVWQTNKINPESKTYWTDTKSNPQFKLQPYQYRSRRCFTDATNKDTLRKGYLYVENLKARDYATGGYCLLPYNGAAGAITSDESEK